MAVELNKNQAPAKLTLNYALTNAYFRQVRPRYGGAVGMIVPGAVIATLGMIMLAAPNKMPAVIFLLIGLSLAGGGIALIVVRKRRYAEELNNLPADEEYDTEIFNYLGNIPEQVGEKLGLTPEERADAMITVFDGYEFDGATKVIQGDDGLWRTNRYQCVCFFCCEQGLHCYTLRFFTTEENRSETAEFVLYRDIVSVSVASEAGPVQREAFTLLTSAGNKIGVSLRGSQKNLDSIRMMRDLIRSKKTAKQAV